MNQIYDNLNDARKRLFEMQAVATDDVVRLELDIVAMAVDDGLDELDRLGKQIKEMGRVWE